MSCNDVCPRAFVCVCDVGRFLANGEQKRWQMPRKPNAVTDNELTDESYRHTNILIHAECSWVYAVHALYADGLPTCNVRIWIWPTLCGQFDVVVVVVVVVRAQCTTLSYSDIRTRALCAMWVCVWLTALSCTHTNIYIYTMFILVGIIANMMLIKYIAVRIISIRSKSF